MTAAGDRRVAIACQGGGSHTAFAAGVLARWFEDGLDGHEIVGLSGTSGGAICALLAWSALRAGDPAGAGPLLEQFWADNSATTPWEQWLNSAVALAGELQQFVAMPEVSPYDNPFAETGAREFRRLLELAGNLSLYQELRFIEQIDQMLEAGQLVQDGSYRRIVVRIIELSPARVSRPLGACSKVDRDPALIGELIAHGRQQADEFLVALGLEQAWRRRDPEAMLKLFDDDAELVATAPFAPAGPVRGRASVSAFLAENLGTLQLDLTRKQVAREHVTWSVKTQLAGVRATARIAVRDGRIISLALGPAAADR